MTEKLESFSSRKLASESNVMTTQNILREARMLKNVIGKDPKEGVKEEEDEELKEEEEREEQHRSFSRTGNDLIETDDELVEVRCHEYKYKCKNIQKKIQKKNIATDDELVEVSCK